jgi:hypothetical protein
MSPTTHPVTGTPIQVLAIRYEGPLVITSYRTLEASELGPAGWEGTHATTRCTHPEDTLVVTADRTRPLVVCTACGEDLSPA